MAIELRFEIAGGDFNHAGKASSKIKKMLKQLNIDTKSIKRVVVAVYEAEMNVVAHAFKGELVAEIGENTFKATIKDEGPGIENIEQALQPGFSTASQEVRQMGFGAGMGLPNIKKNSDSFDLKSTPGKGTVLFFMNYY